MDDNSGFEKYAVGVVAYRWIAGRKVVAIGKTQEEAAAKLADAVMLDGRLQQRVRAGKHLLAATDR